MIQETIIEVNEQILALEEKLRSDFPELGKYITEMPVKLTYEGNTEIRLKSLQDYRHSLKELMAHYALTHEKLDSVNLLPEGI